MSKTEKVARLFLAIPPLFYKHPLKLQCNAASSLAGKIFDSNPQKTARKISVIAGMINKGK